MDVVRALSCFSVTIFVVFLSSSLYGQVQCRYLFDKTTYDSIYLPIAGDLIPSNSYTKINKLPDGVYNFILLADGTLQLGQKFQGSHLKPTQNLASHKSLFNGYLETSRALHKNPSQVISAGKMILINKQISQISNLNFDFKSLKESDFIILLSSLKKQGVSMTPTTRVKIYSTSTLENSIFKQQTQLRDLERAQVMSEKNQNPDLALLWMNAKQFYRQVHALFPSQKTAGTIDLTILERQLRPYLSDQQKETLFKDVLSFLRLVESQGILLTVFHQYKNAQEKNPIQQFRDISAYFLKLLELYKSENHQSSPQMDLLLTN